MNCQKRINGILIAGMWLSTTLLFSQQEEANKYYNDSSAYDVKCYELRITATPDSLYLKGSTQIHAQALKKTLNKFYIQLNHALKVDSLIINGLKCSFEHANYWIKASLPQPIAAGNTFHAQIFYHGYAVSSNALEGLGIGMNTGISNNHECKVFYTLSEPYAALDFFACKQWVSDKADSVKIYITTDKSYIAVANGILKKIEETLSGFHTFYWESRYPIAYYLIGFAIGNFRQYNFKFYSSAARDSVLFQNFHCYNDSDYLAVKPQIDSTISLIRFFETLTNIPYPFAREKYGHVVVPIGGGMENQTITFLQNFDYTLVAHELAHSWFGNYVTCSDWQNIWINEGFATYMSYLAVEKFYPENSLGWLSYCLNLALRDSLATVYIPNDKVFDPLRIFSYTNTYMKGAYLLHTLRYFVGSDSLYFQVWNSFLKKFAYGNAGVEEFKNILEEKTNKSWKWFFDQWFYGQGYPIINIKARLQNNFLSLTAYNKPSSSYNQYTELPVPIHVLLENGKDTILTLRISNNPTTFSFLFHTKIREIKIDPKMWLLAKYETTITSDTTPLS
ncbi:MAG: M1 family metallopeptidase, partial [Bacteroidales bacterium]|nr:M1 family metallopeptidase [Bacteroidales bacterium]